MKRLAVFSLLLFFSITAYARDEPEEPEEPVIVQFNNLLSVKASLGYNYMFFDETLPGFSARTNRPMDIGFGVGIKNIFFGFSLSIPFLINTDYDKSVSFDINFNYYYKDKSFTTGFVKYYGGFYNNTDGNINLQILTFGISHEFLLNRNHSLKSVYNLVEKQTKSNGSFLVGGGLFFTAIQSNDISDFSRNERTFHVGPNFGYSYTWVMRRGFFINALSTFGVDLLVNVNDGKVSAGLQILPRFSAGYHGKKWSANIFYTSSILMGGFRTDMEYSLISGNIGLSFILRFL